MNKIFIYFKYRLYATGRSFVQFLKNLGSIESMWTIFAGFFGFSLVFFFGYKDRNYLEYAVILSVPLIIITFYLDYKKGEFMHWERERYKNKYKEELKNGTTEESDNSGK